MADLDDFFAKKDKKKSKVKPKFLTTPEELVKNLEESKREATNKPKKPEIVGNLGSGGAAAATTATAATVAGVAGNNETSTDVQNSKVNEQQQADEEWKEFEEEQRKDYTGLKIGQLNVNDEDEESASDGDEEELDSDGNATVDTNSNKRSGNGPWKKLIPAEEVTQIPVEIEKPSKVYISPALRQSQASGTGMRPIRNRAAPDITNAEFFPSLSAARPEEQRKKKNEPAFEEVRHGGRVQRVQEQVTAPSAATNRFQSLDDEADS